MVMPMVSFHYSSEEEMSMENMRQLAKEHGVPSFLRDDGEVEFDPQEFSHFVREQRSKKEFEPSYEMVGGFNIAQSSVTGTFSRQWTRNFATELHAESSVFRSLTYVRLVSLSPPNHHIVFFCNRF